MIFFILKYNYILLLLLLSILMISKTFNKDFYEGNKGRVMLELTKTFKGDSRFQLDDRFKDDI